MRKVMVVSSKYDGTLRDEYETYLYEETDETITLFSPPGLKYWDHRKLAWLEAPDGLIEIYFKHMWFNVWHICEQIRHAELMYVNITMPATFHRSQIEWVDLDLDYRVHPDNRIERLDQDEFDENSRRMSYPPDVLEQVRRACREVEAGLDSRAYPFDHDQQVELYQRLKTGLQQGHTP
jgi:protein associated with RNAse G/E